MGRAQTRELDRRDWSFQQRFRALDYEFCVRSDVAGVGRIVCRLLAPFIDPAAGRSAHIYTLTHRLSPGLEDERRIYCYELFQDGESIQRVPNPGSMLDWVILDSTRRAVEGTDRYLAVHAAVASLDGHAVLMPARPDSGKTTLVAGLTRAGFQFLGDEVALIEPGTALVHPYLRPLLIEPSSMPVLDGLASDLPVFYEGFRGLRYHVAAEDLRAGSIGAPGPVAFVVFPAYRAGSDTRLRPISRAAALIRIAEQSFNQPVMGRLGARTLFDLVEGARCYELPIGDLRDAIREVRGLFEHSVASANGRMVTV